MTPLPAKYTHCDRRELARERSYLAWCGPSYLPADLDAALSARIGLNVELQE